MGLERNWPLQLVSIAKLRLSDLVLKLDYP